MDYKIVFPKSEKKIIKKGIINVHLIAFLLILNVFPVRNCSAAKELIPLMEAGALQEINPKQIFEQFKNFITEGEDFRLPISGGVAKGFAQGSVIIISVVMGGANTMNMPLVNNKGGILPYGSMLGTSFLTMSQFYNAGRGFVLFVSPPSAISNAGIDVITKYRLILAPNLYGWTQEEGLGMLVKLSLFVASAVLAYYYASPDAVSSGRTVENFFYCDPESTDSKSRHSGNFTFPINGTFSSEEEEESSHYEPGTTTAYHVGYWFNFASTFGMILPMMQSVALDIGTKLVDFPKAAILLINEVAQKGKGVSLKALIPIPAFVSQLANIGSLDEANLELLKESLRSSGYTETRVAAFIKDFQEIIEGLVSGNVKQEDVAYMIYMKSIPVIGDRLAKTPHVNGAVAATRLFSNALKIGAYAWLGAQLGNSLSYTFTSGQAIDYAESTLGFSMNPDNEELSFQGRPVDETSCDNWPECKAARDQLDTRKFENWRGYFVQGAAISTIITDMYYPIVLSLGSLMLDWQNPGQGKSIVAIYCFGCAIGGIGQGFYLAHTTGEATTEAIDEAQTYERELGMHQYNDDAPESISWQSRIALAGMFLPAYPAVFLAAYYGLRKRNP